MNIQITEQLVHQLLPPRPDDSHKGTFGTLSIAAGCRRYRGAAQLAAAGALASGIGIVRIASVEAVCAAIAVNFPCCILLPLPEQSGGLASSGAGSLLQCRQSALLAGCGMGSNRETAGFVQTILAGASQPVLLDADALNALAGHWETGLCQEQRETGLAGLRQCAATVVITPHILEMARLCGLGIEEVAADSQKIALQFAREYGCTVVLKSSQTMVAEPGGRSFTLENAANSALAKAGSGDVLAGIVAGLLAQQLPAADAAVCGVWLHAAAAKAGAAEKSKTGFSPADIPHYMDALWLGMGR